MTEHTTPTDRPGDFDAARFGRRTLIAGAGAIALAACASEAIDVTESTVRPASGGDGPNSQPAPTAIDASSIAALTPADFDSLAVCAVLPSSTAGPFPTLEQLDRRDVTDGRPGEPLRLGVRVVDSACAPLSGADVEIWHTDATGDYSSYSDGGSGKDEGEGTTFCRGFQVSNGDGIAEFQTIYPGWYEGRAVHIHLRVRLDGSNVLTCQLYFDEEYTARVFGTGEYAQFGPPDTSWADDGIIGDPTTDGSGITLTRAETSLGAGTLGLVNVGVPPER